MAAFRSGLPERGAQPRCQPWPPLFGCVVRLHDRCRLAFSFDYEPVENCALLQGGSIMATGQTVNVTQVIDGGRFEM